MDWARGKGGTLTAQKVAEYRWLLAVVALLVAAGEFFAVQVGRYQWIGGLAIVGLLVTGIRAHVGRSGLLMILGLRRHRGEADSGL